jgi:hypothetical protein
MEMWNKLKEADAEEVKVVFTKLLEDYLHPAFGSMSKRDFDILLFMNLQKLGIFEKNPEIYDLVSQLKVTRSKARNLLYESKLRQTSTSELDEELKLVLQTPIFLKDQDKIGIEIDNPYLIDHLRSKLKKLNHITDGSFSIELVKLTTDAFIDLFESYMPNESKADITKAFVQIGVKTDASFKGVLKGVLKKIGKKIADDAGAEVAESVGDYLGPIINGSVKMVTDKLTTLYEYTEEE